MKRERYSVKSTFARSQEARTWSPGPPQGPGSFGGAR